MSRQRDVPEILRKSLIVDNSVLGGKSGDVVEMISQLETITKQLPTELRNHSWIFCLDYPSAGSRRGEVQEGRIAIAYGRAHGPLGVLLYTKLYTKIR